MQCIFHGNFSDDGKYYNLLNLQTFKIIRSRTLKGVFMSATNSTPDSAAISQQQESSEPPKKKTKLGGPMQQPAAIQKLYIKMTHPTNIL